MERCGASGSLHLLPPDAFKASAGGTARLDRVKSHHVG
ncbi:hypothetical protein COLO4_10443 [Corchorus olitorius]|uniref:Uncharacterized protein n=1 Tax=Corchorus olitorius TaxID=93759 RepID=A0A1R3K8J3_9ROSI|nr:hypothetical protein COLO4_10443 [Corchorus olitorius]